MADTPGDHDTRLWRVALTRSIQQLATFTSMSAKSDPYAKKYHGAFTVSVGREIKFTSGEILQEGLEML